MSAVSKGGGSDAEKGAATGHTNPNSESQIPVTPTDPVSDVLPEGGYGWVIVGCQIGVNAVTWGMFSTHFQRVDLPS